MITANCSSASIQNRLLYVIVSWNEEMKMVIYSKVPFKDVFTSGTIPLESLSEFPSLSSLICTYYYNYDVDCCCCYDDERKEEVDDGVAIDLHWCCYWPMCGLDDANCCQHCPNSRYSRCVECVLDPLDCLLWCLYAVARWNRWLLPEPFLAQSC